MGFQLELQLGSGYQLDYTTGYDQTYLKGLVDGVLKTSSLINDKMNAYNEQTEPVILTKLQSNENKYSPFFFRKT